MKRFIFTSLFLIFGGLSVLFIHFKNLKQPVCGVKDFEPFCGTQNLTEKASEGKQIFNANCAACHKLNRIMTGPALLNAIKKYDSISFNHFVIKGERLKSIDKSFNSACIKFPNLTTKETYNLLKYISK
ncbi:c-type cytochrome [Winogradskyella sp. PE311]|uniref:c-type cytochrome n=1 Tax=Winogradskyella sp. PE311 TaxID=3366943 RepID=UPI00397E9A7B